ncbi:hypothetical protein P8C59_006906 [Phyllachora maydis]|uniref:Uncharacterized protein n=1 Tax=Phyllachora maydis TaxID=1825666 RepID=A0AAD9I788_9PEZI|nr:hypothetical protein P8C59_006906 [Phyllachora maydis]
MADQSSQRSPHVDPIGCVNKYPYRLEAPWHAFEFAFHILEVEANVVIVSMAWVSREERSSFTRTPEEPDMETLTYWVQRLEPVIRAERENEMIVVFCNRCGVEDDAVYSGTSAVLGIRGGEVSVYGLLGRGVQEMLVVDTGDAPFAKLLNRPEPVESAPPATASPVKSRGTFVFHVARNSPVIFA